MIEPVQRILRVFERHRLWESGVELIGSWCFLLYQKHFGVPSFPLRTQDVDFLLPYPYQDKRQVDLIAELEKLGFRRDFRPDGSTYLWSAELRIDFIAPDRGRGLEKAALIEPLGISAMPLRFVGMLLDHPVTVEERGVKIAIPDPAIFCLHKLLVSSRRRQAEARRKDLEQALLVGASIQPSRLRRDFDGLPKAWQRTILKNLVGADRLLSLLKQEREGLMGALS